MRKFLLGTLSVLCAGFAALGVACTDNGNNGNNDGNSDIVVLNGFNHWDDMVVIYLDPATFGGSMKLNKDEQYIVEGNSSYKCYIESTYANQPELKMAAAGRKTDITDVTQFGLYIYNANDYAFDIIVTAYAGDKVVCSPYATAEVGANNLTFDINRALVQNAGKVITDYSISLSGVRRGATFYIDNFHLKTTKDALVVSQAAQTVINDINALGTDATRTAVEAVMDKYNALTQAEKETITNFERLESLIKPYWMNDLDAARSEDSSKLLIFDRYFAGVQIKSKTSGVGTYGYSEDMAYGEENGSLRVDFALTSINWVNICTTAGGAVVDEQYLEFYVYNDSDQYKAMCVGWNVPINANYATYMVLEPHAWTQVWVESDHLTTGNSGGIFEVCGLSDMTDRIASAPKGSLYFSSVTKIRPSQAAQAVIDEISVLKSSSSKSKVQTAMDHYNALTTADKQSVTNYDVLKGLMNKFWAIDLTSAQTTDKDTLLFFDEKFGAAQIESAGSGISAYGYSEEQAYGDESGSLKVDFMVKAPGFMPSDGWKYLYTTATTDIEEEYIEFYVYNDSDQYKGLCLGWMDTTGHGLVLNPNTWTKVFCKSTDLTMGLTQDEGKTYPYRGCMQIVGLSDLTNLSARAPEGSLYFSSIQKYDPSKKVQQARTGADTNTLMFFDREIGAMQAIPTVGDVSYSANTMYDGNAGALKVSFDGTQSEAADAPILGFLTCNYQFNEGDYVVFNVKADITAKYMTLRIGSSTAYATYCHSGKWTQVIFPAAAIEKKQDLRFNATNTAGTYWNDEDVDMEGNVYITKVKVLSASEIKDLSSMGSEGEYNIGQTTFVGAPIWHQKGDYIRSDIFNQGYIDTDAALIGDTLRFYARANESNANTVQKTVIGLELKEATDKDMMYIVASGMDHSDSDTFHLQVMTDREGRAGVVHYASPRPVSVEVLEDGYVRYAFDLSTYNNSLKYFRLFTGQKLSNKGVELIQIRDIYFGDKI